MRFSHNLAQGFEEMAIDRDFLIQKAVRSERLDELREYISEHPEFVLHQAEDGTSPLHWAERPETVRLLIQMGADVNARDNENKTPLHHAVLNADSVVLEELIKNGASVNALDGHGHSSIFYAALYDMSERYEVLLQSADAQTDVFTAAVLGDTPMLRELLKRSPSQLKNTDGFRRTPLHLASLKGRSECVELLLSKGADVTARSETGDTPLHFAARGQELSVVEHLLSAGADSTRKNDAGVTPAEIACGFDDLTVAKRLYHATQRTDFLPACCFDTVEHVRQMIAESPSLLDVIDESKDGPLHLCVDSNRHDMLEMLLLCGADPNQREMMLGQTALFNAMYRSDLRSCRLLIESGANVNARDEFGLSILVRAVQKGDLETVAILVEYSASTVDEVNPLLIEAVLGSHPQIVRFFLEETDISVNGQDSSGASALYHAVEDDDLEIVKMLLEHGADPLLKAIEKDNEIEDVLELEDDLLSEDTEPFGYSPLTLAEEMNNPAMIKLLRRTHR